MREPNDRTHHCDNWKRLQLLSCSSSMHRLRFCATFLVDYCLCQVNDNTCICRQANFWEAILSFEFMNVTVYRACVFLSSVVGIQFYVLIDARAVGLHSCSYLFLQT